MMLDTMHPEDVKATIRKRYGSVRNFVTTHGLPATGVSDIFRGRTSGRVREAIEALLAEEKDGSIILDRSKARDALHLSKGKAA